MSRDHQKWDAVHSGHYQEELAGLVETAVHEAGCRVHYFYNRAVEYRKALGVEPRRKSFEQVLNALNI
ncbi:hypothetical protein scyTo_0004739 [Scyliorhinus torazame]|uniref:Uncharacterized protein n=1 Tax=Scyliorhinus torazame TaxID=75743 RepID=A0A401NWJ5_SCYTO|nr:hypothetical protein [Scyliorhinus torazame]